MLKAPNHDGESAYNSESAIIERYDGGFLVEVRGTGERNWFPDVSVFKALWTKQTIEQAKDES